VSGGELAVVVGASGALGGAIAARLLAEGLTVIGVARGATGQRSDAGDAAGGDAASDAAGGAGGDAAGGGAGGDAASGAAGGDATSGAAGGDATSGAARGGATSGAARGSAAGSGAGAAGSSGAMEWCAADIGSDDAVAAVAAAVGDRPVRMVVQAAGLPAAGPLATIEPDALGRAVALKCGGLLRLVRAVDGHLQPGARLVALGGHYGIEPAPYACAAGVTNAALANLVRQLATAYGPRGVTAHLVAPGPADTPRLRALSRQAAETRGVPVDTVLAERAAESPLGRLVTPAEVAWAVATLLAPEAAALDGSALSLDVGARRGIF
jgi:NAD(P)-dependent dehydrogenase (short-subunit alcohol dehydrogenase family)